MENIEQRMLLNAYIVSNEADSGAGSLRQAVANAAAMPGPDTITFNIPGAGPHTIALKAAINVGGGELVTIEGPGATKLTLAGSGTGLVTDWNTPFDISGMTFTGGKTALLNYGSGRITDCAFVGNSTSGAGGAISNRAELTVVGSTFQGNHARKGAAVYSTGALTMINCTIVGNSSTGPGGAVVSEAAGAEATLLNCTISGNAASTGGGVYTDGEGEVRIANSVVTNNTATWAGRDTYGLFTSLGHNFISVDAGLSSTLALNGGETMTLAPLPGSPVIDAGNDSLVPAEVTTDQRGTGRYCGTVDVGAMEAHDYAVMAPDHTLYVIGCPGDDVTSVSSSGGVVGVQIHDARNDFNFSFTGASAPVSVAGLGGADDVNVAGATVSVSSEPLRSLSVTGSGAKVTVASGGARALIVGQLPVIGPGAAVNLTDHDLIIRHDGVGTWNGSAYTGATGMVATGRAGASGLISPMASGNYMHLAVSSAKDALALPIGGSGVFDGVAVKWDDVLVKYTYGGDANLDGRLNVDDLARVDYNAPLSGSVFGYSNGDFNLDGRIDVDDYGIIDFNMGIASHVSSPAASTPAIWGGSVVRPTDRLVSLLFPA